MLELWQRVGQAITTRQLVARGESLLVAVSGGADSMVLLEVLRRLAPQQAWRLVLAHFQHRLRGAESLADAELVREVASKYHLPLVEENWLHEEDARLRQHGGEMAARLARHEFLARAAATTGCRTIALAHHADDQAELFFIRLFRGAGGEGLGGMQQTNPSPVDASMRLIRPLLGETRAALRTFATRHGIVFREDASNADRAHERNRVRHELLPLLARDFEPAITATVGRSMEIVRADADFVRLAAEKWVAARRRANFATLHPAVQRQAVRLQLRALGVVAEFDLVEHLRQRADLRTTVRPGMVAWRTSDGRIVTGAAAPPAFNAAQAEFVLAEHKGDMHFSRLHIHWEREARAGDRRNSTDSRGGELFDADKVGQQIVLRHWRAGDRFHPIGMPGPVKVQDLFAAARVPRTERHERVVAVTESGGLFWVEGLRMSEQFKLDKKSGRRLKWQWVRP